MSGNYKTHTLGIGAHLSDPGLLHSELWDTLKNGSRRAALAGHGQAVAKEVHVLALDLMQKRGLSYDEAEKLIVDVIPNEAANKIKFNAALDKYSQPMKPGPNLDQTNEHVHMIMKHRQVNKSSKGKHPSNYTPPKKKRK